MTTAIRFGTSGWRAIVADEFTVANIRLAVAGIAAFVKTQPEPHRVLVGRDPRFLGESFVETAACVLAGAGITPIIIPEAAPTPAIAYAVRELKTSGAINFTASHNPPEYNGIKFSTHDGAPALPEVTKQIEAAVKALQASGAAIPQANPPADGFETADVKPSFLKRLAELVDLKAIAASGIKIVYDPFWGAGRGYSSEILRAAGVAVETVHDYRDVLFGGHAPEPDDHLLGDCKAKMKETGAALGIATDGDADRFGIVDADGTFIQPNYIIALLFDYLVETRGWRNGVAKSVATTNLINALADFHKVPLYETPVGFKYIGELINQDKIAIGGEESAGIVPAKSCAPSHSTARPLRQPPADFGVPSQKPFSIRPNAYGFFARAKVFSRPPSERNFFNAASDSARARRLFAAIRCVGRTTNPASSSGTRYVSTASEPGRRVVLWWSRLTE